MKRPDFPDIGNEKDVARHRLQVAKESIRTMWLLEYCREKWEGRLLKQKKSGMQVIMTPFTLHLKKILFSKWKQRTSWFYY